MVKTRRKSYKKIVYYLLAPVRILRSARDFYASTLCDCAMITHGSMVAGYATLPLQISHLPSMRESNKDMEDLRELNRAMTMRNKATKGGNNYSRVVTDRPRRLRVTVEGGGSGRSYSFGVGRIGRIDEDMPCEFVEVVGFNKNFGVSSRSRSYGTN